MTDFQQKAAKVKAKVYASGLTGAEVARRLGKGSEAGTAYVRQVLNGRLVSNPLLVEVEAVIEAETAERQEA